MTTLNTRYHLPDPRKSDNLSANGTNNFEALPETKMLVLQNTGHKLIRQTGGQVCYSQCIVI